MWIRTENNELVNLDRITAINVEDTAEGSWSCVQACDSVEATMRVSGPHTTLLSFKDREVADKCVAIILLCIEAGRKTLDLTSDVVLKNIKSGVMP